MCCTAPPPRDAELPPRLERTCAFANTLVAEEPFLHPVLRSIPLLAYDHPFLDGNGRVARALFLYAEHAKSTRPTFSSINRAFSASR